MGHTNREVAQTLFITVSTVEQHLTRIYRKLNVSGRSDLAVFLELTTDPDEMLGVDRHALGADFAGEHRAILAQ